jgi:hypothetical protein
MNMRPTVRPNQVGQFVQIPDGTFEGMHGLIDWRFILISNRAISGPNKAISEQKKRLLRLIHFKFERERGKLLRLPLSPHIQS